jgi:hypothetical protein
MTKQLAYDAHSGVHAAKETQTDANLGHAMYCKKCKFHSFDHVSTCPKCGADWEETRKALYLNWITASGVNWIASAKTDSQSAATTQPAQTFRSTPAPAAAAPAALDSDPLLDALSDSSSTFRPTLVATPSPAARRDADIDVSLFPELDFSTYQPEAPAKTQTSTPVSATPTVNDDLFLESVPAEEVLELDFSTVAEAPTAPKTPAPAKPKREDLFIPELEEMLAPLTDEPRPTPKKPAFTEEKDILLDFGPRSGSGASRQAGNEMDYLELDEQKKSS